MAQIKVLKVAADGVPLEHTDTADDVTFNSFSVQGGGPVLSGTGLDMSNQDVSDIKNLEFNDPSVNTIEQTAGALVIDNIMAKERNNVMTTAGAVLFPLVTDTGAELDSFKVPHLAGIPTATPTFSSDGGYLAFDSTNKDLYIWDGAAWDNLNVSESAESILNMYTADEALSARDVLYISAADNVSKAIADNTSASYAMGLAKAAAADTNPVQVQSEGVMTGFSALTPGARYYLSDVTAGAITSTIPTSSGKTIVQVGYAKSATALHIHIEQMGRRV